jgi:hypothetical protein
MPVIPISPSDPQLPILSPFYYCISNDRFWWLTFAVRNGGREGVGVLGVDRIREWRVEEKAVRSLLRRLVALVNAWRWGLSPKGWWCFRNGQMQTIAAGGDGKLGSRTPCSLRFNRYWMPKLGAGTHALGCGRPAGLNEFGNPSRLKGQLLSTESCTVGHWDDHAALRTPCFTGF